MLRDRKNLFISDTGLLKRKCESHEQLVLPQVMKDTIYEQLHINMGHLGPDRVFELARQRVYWPGMHREIADFISNRCQCLARKKPRVLPQAPMQSIITSAPMDLVAFDYLHLEKSSGGYEYIMIISDHFTRYTQAYATRNKSSVTAAKCFYDDFVLKFGLPGKILHDQGREWENKLFDDLRKLSGVHDLRTTPYHPQTNGLVERMNSTVLQMLRTLTGEEKKKWHSSLSKMMHAYNCTKHDSTGFSPFYLMFGSHPRIPMDFMLGEDEQRQTKPKLYTKYAEEWEARMKIAYEIANQRSINSKEYQKARKDKRRLALPLAIGDRVLAKNVETGGPGKLRSYWQDNVYIVKDVKENGVVYTIVREEDGKGTWTVHRNMLTPCEHLIIDEPVDVDTGLAKRVTRSSRSSPAVEQNEECNSSSDSDDELSFLPALSALSETAAIPTTEPTTDEKSDLTTNEELLTVSRGMMSSTNGENETTKGTTEPTTDEQNDLTTNEELLTLSREMISSTNGENEATKATTMPSKTSKEMIILQAEMPSADNECTSSETLQEPAVIDDDNGAASSANSEDEDSISTESNEKPEDQQLEEEGRRRRSIESRLNCLRERRKLREERGSETQVDILLNKWRKKCDQLKQAKDGTTANTVLPVTSTPRQSTRVKKAPDLFVPTF